MYDIPLQLAEMERTPKLDPSTLSLLNIHFSDTLTSMRQASKLMNFKKILCVQALLFSN